MGTKITLRPRRKWTDADIKEMIDLLKKGMSVAMVAKRMKRTEAAIRVQATLRRVSASSNLAQRAKRNLELGR